MISLLTHGPFRRLIESDILVHYFEYFYAPEVSLQVGGGGKRFVVGNERDELKPIPQEAGSHSSVNCDRSTIGSPHDFEGSNPPPPPTFQVYYLACIFITSDEWKTGNGLLRNNHETADDRIYLFEWCGSNFSPLYRRNS